MHSHHSGSRNKKKNNNNNYNTYTKVIYMTNIKLISITTLHKLISSFYQSQINYLNVSNSPTVLFIRSGNKWDWFSMYFCSPLASTLSIQKRKINKQIKKLSKQKESVIINPPQGNRHRMSESSLQS